ncbi:MAG: ABC transporter substrate-binding protein [Planctomycetes bacterium]|nr:ABC transporter substrate-binding protein [Planctomycetota bacterium]
MKTLISILFATATMLAGGRVDPAPPPPPPKIKVGLIVSTTGALASFGSDTKNGVDLAVQEINKAGGIGGQEIEIVFQDCASKPEEAESAAKVLTAKKKVVACIGCVASGLTLAAGPVFQKAGVPLISPTATNPTVTQQGKMIFRGCFMDDFQGEGIAVYAFSDMKAKTAAILSNQDDAYSTALAGFFKDKFIELGGKIVSERSFRYTAEDYSTEISAIKAAAPDVVFAPVYYNDLLAIAKQSKKLEYEPKLLGSDGWESRQLLAEDAVGVEDSVFANHFCTGQGQEAKAFAASYQKEYGEEPSSLAALGYDTVCMLASALADAATADGDKIAEALGALKEFNGVTGKNIRMGKDRNPEKPLVMVKIQKGEFAFVRELTYEEVRPPKKK